jgi:type II secretory pathway pseudopilin PulG
MHPVERIHLPAHGVSLGHLLLETVMIVFSVLLALGLESWREHRVQRARAHQALVAVRSELTHNIEAIEAQLPKQREVLEGLEAAARDLGTGGKTAPVNVPLRPPIFTGAAWQAAVTTQAMSHVDLRVIQTVAGVYEGHRWMDRIEDDWLRTMTAPRSGSPAGEQQWLRSMQFVVSVYMELEEALAAKAKAAVTVLPAD